MDRLFAVGGPTDIEDFLDFIEHPETHNDLQGSFDLSDRSPFLIHCL